MRTYSKKLKVLENCFKKPKVFVSFVIDRLILKIDVDFTHLVYHFYFILCLIFWLYIYCFNKIVNFKRLFLLFNWLFLVSIYQIFLSLFYNFIHLNLLLFYNFFFLFFQIFKKFINIVITIEIFFITFSNVNFINLRLFYFFVLSDYIIIFFK